jgi:hypothetical protein
MDEKKVPVIFNDNQSAQMLSNNRRFFSKRTKHVELKYNFIREAIEKNKVKLDYIHSEELMADLLTIALSAPKPEYFRHELNLTA